MWNSYWGFIDSIKKLLEIGLVSIDEKDAVSSLAVAHAFHSLACNLYSPCPLTTISFDRTAAPCWTTRLSPRAKDVLGAIWTRLSHSCNPVCTGLNAPHSCSLDRITCRQAQGYLHSSPKTYSRFNSCACPRRPRSYSAEAAAPSSLSCQRNFVWPTRYLDHASAGDASQASLSCLHRSPFNHTFAAINFVQSIRTPRIFFHPQPQAIRSPGLLPMSASGSCRSKWTYIVLISKRIASTAKC